MPTANDAPRSAAPPVGIWTIGHSNSSADEFIAALRAHGVEVVADVRRFPGSRKHPQFGPALAETLAALGIDYAWLAKLGGRRRDEPGIRQLGWRSPSFRSYAAFMWSEEFAEALGELTAIAQAMPTAVMCSEHAPAQDVTRRRSQSSSTVGSSSGRGSSAYWCGPNTAGR